ncbi:hypothetical protein ACFYP6_21990 [Streptomyces goshikiensis]|uniref:hypothetical protein n=1 Tax=Streptomyces goshikiensis TaxID=1942 RepID=UPI0036CF2D5A
MRIGTEGVVKVDDLAVELAERGGQFPETVDRIKVVGRDENLGSKGGQRLRYPVVRAGTGRRIASPAAGRGYSVAGIPRAMARLTPSA